MIDRKRTVIMLQESMNPLLPPAMRMAMDIPRARPMRIKEPTTEPMLIGLAC